MSIHNNRGTHNLRTFILYQLEDLVHKAIMGYSEVTDDMVWDEIERLVMQRKWR